MSEGLPKKIESVREPAWEAASVVEGTALTLDALEIHPEFADISKELINVFSQKREEIGEEGSTIELYADTFSREGVVNSKGSVEFPIIEHGEKVGALYIPSGYWRLKVTH